MVKHAKNPLKLSKKYCSLVHVLLQSLGSYNISSINASNEVDLYVRRHEKGLCKQNSVWVIELNEARELYLERHSAMGKVDQMLKGWRGYFTRSGDGGFPYETWPSNGIMHV